MGFARENADFLNRPTGDKLVDYTGPAETRKEGLCQCRQQMELSGLIHELSAMKALPIMSGGGNGARCFCRGVSVNESCHGAAIALTAPGPDGTNPNPPEEWPSG
ncbi:MAG: hypothetical protein LBH14_01920 [Desulfobulbaceae bacterium]|nr:hypothetical protein [Desulfobulbaceae bacterium]